MATCFVCVPQRGRASWINSGSISTFVAMCKTSHNSSHIATPLALRPFEDEDDDENEDENPLRGLCHFVYQFAQRSGGDFYDVAGKQREIVWGNDTGTG